MKKDLYGQLIFSESEICELYLKNPDTTLNNVLVESPISFNKNLNLQNIPDIIEYIDPKLSIEDFDKVNQEKWFMPDEYKNFDIASFVLGLCKTDAELQRAGQELLIYQERDMFTLLQYLKYLVDVMRENNIVWGVGRGSSVASFVLYLLGVHKINSLYYDLPIEEFLR